MSVNHVRALLLSAALSPLSVLAADAPTPPKPDTDWSDSIKQPTDWLKFGADLRIRNEYLNNNITLNQDAPGHEMDFQRIRTRLWADVQPCKEFEVFARLAWEGWHYTEPDTGDSWPDQDIIFDNLYARLNLGTKDVGITTTIGRQDIILGTGWLVLEGTPLDASRTIYFDAFRTQFDFKCAKTTLDLIYINQPAEDDAWFHPPYHAEYPMAEENSQGAIVYLTNRTLPAANVEAYFIWKDNDADLANGVNGDIYTFGGALSGELVKNLTYRAEGAGQWGRVNSDDQHGFGFNGRLEYAFKDPMNNRISGGYEYRSGDNPKTKTDEGFDPLWGRYPQWSELWAWNAISETRVAEITNLHRVWVGWDIDPIKPITISARYNALFAPEPGPSAANPMFDGTGHFRGHLFTAELDWKLNRHVSADVACEEFLPGNYYNDDNHDAATYFRVEMTFTL
ncbi:MAG: alginate export family protein [Tepidisphaeraceae bacterium]